MPDLTLRHDPPRPFLCVAGVIHRTDIAARLQDAVRRFSDSPIGRAQQGQQIALYHPQGRDPFGPEGEPFWLGRELEDLMDAPPGLQLNWTPGGEVAVLVHEGPYETMLDTHFALHRAVSERGRRLVGPNWELYGPAQATGRREVEVCYLLKD